MLCVSVSAVLRLCFLSWNDVKSKYLSMCIGLRYISIVIVPIKLEIKVFK